MAICMVKLTNFRFDKTRNEETRVDERMLMKPAEEIRETTEILTKNGRKKVFR